MSKAVIRVLYAVLAVLGAGITALIPVLMSGAAPVPKEWVWAMPVLIAMLVALAALLPKIGHEEQSALTDQVGHRRSVVALRHELERQINADKLPDDPSEVGGA
jgi:hypothetical protein